MTEVPKADGTLSPLTKAVLLYSLKFPPHPGKWRVIKKLVSTLNLHPHGEFLEKRAELLWQFNPEDYVQQNLFWTGTKDAWEVFQLEKVLPEDGVFFDVGANFGYYSLTMGKKLGSKARIYAFEPNPSTFSRLNKNVVLNHAENIHIYAVGFSDFVGTAGMELRADNSGATRLTESGDIPTTTLDEFCHTHPEIGMIHGIKIDIEGFEEKFLKGAGATLERFKPAILIELNPVTLPKSGSSVARVVSLLKQHGYALFEIQRQKLNPLTVLPSSEDHVNALCLHPSNHSSLMH